MDKMRRLIAQIIDGGDSDLADYDPSDEALSKADDILSIIERWLNDKARERR